MGLIKQFFGPRAPAGVPEEERARYRRPSIFLGAAALCLLVSIFVPYWRMTLLAPQYPGGLQIQVYVNRMTGDVAEIDGLNHYIGMRPLDEAAQLERSVSIVGVIVLALLLTAAIVTHTKWAALLALPALMLPFVFLADMYLWMRHFGLNLDPTAPLSSSIKPFVPPILGTGMVGQFETVAAFDWGLWLAFTAVILITVGLYYHRQVYKPLVEQE